MMEQKQKQEQPKKNRKRKHGGHKASCERYRREDRRRKNKVYRLVRHLKQDRHQNDLVAAAALRKHS